MGTQILCANPICFVGFAFALWSFFNTRIQYEEFTLIGFFGEEYLQYKTRVKILIPFIDDINPIETREALEYYRKYNK
jgi:protein-S-isoprenylcysteine O-methyltransferase